MEKLNIVVLNSHPIQYFAPLYRQMAEEETIQLKVYYCSKHGFNGEIDQQFKTGIQWDIPLLDGYDYEFLPNMALKPSIYSFWGLLNFSVLQKLRKLPKGIVLVHGWAYAINWLTIVIGCILGHTICLRAESPLNLERIKNRALLWIRKVLLKQCLFRFVHHFLYIGSQNRAFYEWYGVPADKLIFTPYAVDNQRFLRQYTELSRNTVILKEQLGLPTSKRIILYSGKYVQKKRPLDLLRAFKALNRSDVALVLMGEGELRPVMEQYIRVHQLTDVFLTGFVNQSKVAEYYAVADLYVMCSDERETWGLSTNEAMNFALPLVLSSQVGCADDLLSEAENGFSYSCGDIAELTNTLQQFLYLSTEKIREMGMCSQLKIQTYSYEVIIQKLKEKLLPC
ncbi:hypothetical protein GCM10023187_25000 [Nibrella viscosa]|uniref:Glycosyl transferase family 1 domain-containing protein n=1 Tax=Nibrella viscosa TaxID=1084524 RepID=A0ABP8KFH4_9BACT